MSHRPITAVTFDLWDTVFIDDSDEPKRAARGLPPKPVARRQAVHAALQRQAPTSREQVDLAFDVCDRAFRKVWYEQSITWTVADRLQVLLEGLGRSLPAEDFNELVRFHEEMELEIQPDPVPGALEALRALHGRYRLGVISDAIFSPGRVLRGILSDMGVEDVFDAFIFSDEAGFSKPAPIVFEEAAHGLGVDVSGVVHVGDREAKDVMGPRALGARSILITAAVDRGSDATRADAICTSYDQLDGILASLERGGLP